MDKATELITGEHREVQALFERFEASRDRSVAMQVCELLERHTEMEEEVVYPELRSVDQDLYDDAVEEHQEAAGLISRIRATEDPEEVADLVAELRAAIEHHVDDEETEDLPAMLEACGADRMEALGQQMEQWRSARGGGGAGATVGRDDEETDVPAQR